MRKIALIVLLSFGLVLSTQFVVGQDGETKSEESSEGDGNKETPLPLDEVGLTSSELKKIGSEIKEAFHRIGNVVGEALSPEQQEQLETKELDTIVDDELAPSGTLEELGDADAPSADDADAGIGAPSSDDAGDVASSSDDAGAPSSDDAAAAAAGPSSDDAAAAGAPSSDDAAAAGAPSSGDAGAAGVPSSDDAGAAAPSSGDGGTGAPSSGDAGAGAPSSDDAGAGAPSSGDGGAAAPSPA